MYLIIYKAKKSVCTGMVEFGGGGDRDQGGCGDGCFHLNLSFISTFMDNISKFNEICKDYNTRHTHARTPHTRTRTSIYTENACPSRINYAYYTQII